MYILSKDGKSKLVISQVLPYDEQRSKIFNKKPGNSQRNIEAFFTVYSTQNGDWYALLPHVWNESRTWSVVPAKIAGHPSRNLHSRLLYRICHKHPRHQLLHYHPRCIHHQRHSQKNQSPNKHRQESKNINFLLSQLPVFL